MFSENTLDRIARVSAAIGKRQRGSANLEPFPVILSKLEREWQEFEEADEQWNELPDVAYYLIKLLLAFRSELDRRGVTEEQIVAGLLENTKRCGE